MIIQLILLVIVILHLTGASPNMYVEGFMLRYGSFLMQTRDSFVKTFITQNRWMQLLAGLGVTLLITVVAIVIGILLGFILAAVRSTYDMTLQGRTCRTFLDYLLKVLNAICNVYITIIRGTPVVIQLMIMYFIIFSNWRSGLFPAMLAFGLNSAAYVAEIIRSGIMSIDRGQFEASRSLGFGYFSTMIFVILPQAIKNILPALGNEFIVLLKETSIAGYAAVQDLTYVGNLIRSRTYEAFFPLITVAVVYLIIVLILSFLLKLLEKGLRKSER